MSIFSRRKRLLTRTSARANSGRAASFRAQFRKLFRIRTAAPAMPKMSSRRQFHRALRRHPAWPMVMEQAAARAKAHKESLAAQERLIKQQEAAQKQLRRAANRAKFHRLIRLNRTKFMATEQTSNRRQFRGVLRHNRINAVRAMQAPGGSRLRRVLRPSRTGLMAMGQSSSALVRNFRQGIYERRNSKFRRAVRRNRVLLVTLLAVGGIIGLLTGISLAQGIWTWDTHTSSATGLPPPPARFGAATTYDEANTEVLVFGGFSGLNDSARPVGCTIPGVNLACSNLGPVREALNPPPKPSTLGDTYIYKGSWQRRDSVVSPSSRGFAAMAYDGARKNVVLFGGAPYKSNNVSGETWIWDNNQWTLTNPPAPVPDPRQNAVMVYDPHRKVVMMFGGRGADGKPLNDTWLWDGKKWKTMPPEGAPSPRHSAAIAYDECRAEAVMFGGLGNAENNFFRQPFETWTWDGVKWSEQKPQVSPPGRVGAGMGYSRRSGRLILYGGLTTNDAGVPVAATDHDLWRWNGEGGDGRPPGTGPQQGHAGWEKLNAEVTTATMGPCAALGTNCAIGLISVPPVPRGYASFASLRHEGSFLLFGGTPNAAITPHPLVDGPQVAFPDHFLFEESTHGAAGHVVFGEAPVFNLDRRQHLGVSEVPPLVRTCDAPPPIPADEAGAIVAPQDEINLQAREGMHEIGQLPVLLGTDWPEANRDTHIYGNPPRPNPNYIPAPDCPNRREGEVGSNTYLITDQKRNRVYQFFACDGNRGNNEKFQTNPAVVNLLIEAYHGTTLKPVGRAVLRNVRPPGSTGLAGAIRSLLIHDTDQGRFLLSSSYYNGSTTVNELVDIRQDLIEKGVDPIAGRSSIAGTPLESGDLPSRFFNHPKTGRAKLFFKVPGGGATAGSPPTVTAGPPPTVTPGSPPAQSTPPKLAQWDIEGKREDWRVELTGCGSSDSPAMRFGDRIYTTCISNNRTAVVRIPVVEDPSVPAGERPGMPEPPYPGPVGGEIIGGDPQAERVVLSQRDTGGWRVWVFDGKVSRWVGRVGITSNSLVQVQLGFDRETARAYVQLPDSAVNIPGQPSYYEQGGLLMVDTGLTPVSQALKFPQFAAFSAGPPVSLPPELGVPRRIFVRQVEPLGGTMKKYPNGETVKMPNEMFYRVIADEVPLPELASLAELDALTIPVTENPAKTEVSFDAEGSGYGIRLRSVGGIWSALRPFAQAYAGNGEFAESFSLGFVRHTIPGCVFPDRELMAGWVPQARLSDIDALARSSGLEVDSNSKTDLTGPFSRCNPSASASNFPPSIKVVFDALWPLWGMVQLEGNKAASQGAAAETGKDADGKCGQIEQGTPATGTPLEKVVVSDCTETPAGTISRGKDSAGSPTVRFDSTTSKWDSHFKEVECVGDALATNTATVGNIYGSAKCVQRQGLVQATARGSASGVGPLAEEASSRGFSVGEGYSTVTVAREPVRGVVVTSTAIAKGIQIPGLSIGYVTTTAVAWSNGRPGEKRASFSRGICNVYRDPPLPVNPASFNDSAPSTGCLTENQQKALVNNWNTRWGVNSKMILPAYDPDFYRGSPGGYIAGVIKPVANETEDQLFAKDFLKEVPGLEIHFYKDSETQGPARQTLQLAAVRAIAGFGVQCNPDHIYSPQSKDCVALAFEDDLLTEEFFEEEESEDDAFNSYDEDSDGGWTEVEAIAPALSLGKRIGNFIQNLPVFRRLPIRQMGEALLAGSVWMLLGMPLFLASRRFALNLARKS